MIQPQEPQMVIHKVVCLLFTMMLFISVAFAQNNGKTTAAKPSTTKPKKAAAPKKVTLASLGVAVTIDTATINLVANAADAANSTQFVQAKVKFLVAGNVPKTDVPIKLLINDFTVGAKPLFNNLLSSSNNISLSVPKNSFPGIGKTDTVTIPVVFKFKKTTSERGVAVVEIDGQPEIAKLNFGPPAAPKVKHVVTLLDSITTIQLDTLKPGAVNPYAIKLYLKLNKATGVDTDVKLVLKEVSDKNDITTNLNNSTLKISGSDWNSKKDTTVSKTVYLFVKQKTTVTTEEDQLLSIVGAPDSHTIKLLPSNTKAKTLQLVQQGQAAIQSGKVGVSRSFGKVNSIDSINIKVKIYGEWKSNHNQLVFSFLDTNVAKHFQIMENPLTITNDEWDNAIRKNGVLEIPLHLKTTNLNDSLAHTSYIDLVLKGQQNIFRGSQKIKLSTKDSPFWFEAGTNFDLLDNIKTNNFYAGVYAFDKDIGRIGGTKGENNLSFTGGVYESQSVSSSATTSAGIAYRYTNSVYRDTGAVKATTSVKNIGILFSPHLKLTNGITDANGLHLFLSLYTELLWQTITSNFNYPKDSTIVAAPPMAKEQYPYKENTLSYDFRSHYFGFGLPVYIKEKEFNLYINPVIGLTTQKFYVTNQPYNTTADPLISNYINNLTFLQPKTRWNSFFLVQYRLNEVAYGITFSGEIRGLLLQNAKPVVTLALSKKFDLSALLKPIVAPF